MEAETTTERTASLGFGDLLRDWRRYRGWSQLDLSEEADVSARHVSFLETGRSTPSRGMVIRLAEALDIPLRERNRLFLCAGFAPVYDSSRLDEPQLGQVRRVVHQLLDRHHPYPAYAMDGSWNVVAANRAHTELVAALLPDADAEGRENVLHLLFSPALLRPYVENWEACARTVLKRVQHELRGPVAARSGLATIVEEIHEYPGTERLLAEETDPSDFELFIPVTVRFGEHRLHWMTTILGFGGALDVTLAELCVECFFPADEQTERLARKLWGGDSDGARVRSMAGG